MVKRGKKTELSLKEVTKEESEIDLKRTFYLLDQFRKQYNSYFKKIVKEPVQIRCQNAEILLQSIIHDSHLPTYHILGVLEKIKTDLLNNLNMEPEPKKEAPFYAS